MADSKVELNAENLEGVAGGAAKVDTGDVGNTQTGGGADKRGNTEGSKINGDNVKNSNEGGTQKIVNQGRGNTVTKDAEVKFN